MWESVTFWLAKEVAGILFGVACLIAILGASVVIETWHDWQARRRSRGGK